MAIIDRVRRLVEPIVEASAATLYDIEHKGSTVRVLVDHPDGLDLEVITALSRSISHALDEDDPIPGRYTLEVSTPGLERPLRTADHFRRAVGQDVKIKTRPDFDGPRRLTGVIQAVDDAAVQVRIGDEVTTIALPEISLARTVFSWGPAPKPGGRGRQSESSDRKSESEAKSS
jgi:ribosome maturation factor RimP